MIIEPGLQDKLGRQLVLNFPELGRIDADFVEQHLFGFECRQAFILLINRQLITSFQLPAKL